MTEEEIRELEARQAWARSLPAVQARMAQTAPAPAGPAPGDPGFASQFMPAEAAPPPVSRPSGPMPGEPGFGFDQIATEAGPPRPPPSAPALPQGAGQIDMSDMAPKPKTAFDIKGSLPSGAGQVDLSGMGPDTSGGSEAFAPRRSPVEESRPSMGSPGVVIPGGMMPNTEERIVKHGKPVAPGVRDANAQAGGLDMAAAGVERDANAQLYEREREAATAKLMANDSAIQQQQRLSDERDIMVSARLAEIENLNKKARGAPEDIWSTPHILGRLLGFIALTAGTVSMATGGKGGAAPGIALGMTGKFIDGLVNQDIQAKIQNRKQAGKAADDQINLLKLHEERMGNQKKAIEATKLAYYDNILQQMEAYRADHAGQINEAKYNRLQADILDSQAKAANALAIQESADVTDHLQNKYRQAQVVGGTAAGATDIPHQVRLPDGTAYALDTAPLQKEALAEIKMRNDLIANSQEALRVRAQLKKENPLPGTEAYLTGHGLLNELQKKRMDIYSVASGQGVNTKSDVEREEKYGTPYTSGYGTADAITKGTIGVNPWADARRAAGDTVIRKQIESEGATMRRMMESLGGRIVKSGYNEDPRTGKLAPAAEFTGQNATMKPGLPPAGSRPRDPSIKTYPTESELPVSESERRAQIVSRMSPPSADRSKKKKKKN